MNSPENGLKALAVATSLALTMSPYTNAQDAGAQSSNALEEIVVTARKISESIQDAPVSVTAFSSQAIEDAGITQTADFIQLTSNVTLAESQSVSTSFLTIRGLSQVRNGEIPVAVVIDGVLQFNNRQFVQQLFDVEQIEVVKGPQGALYGRNATGGAVIINTKKPSNESEGYVKFGIGKADEVVTEGSVSGAIIEDELYFRVSGRSINRDGYFTNVTRQDDSDPLSDQSLRGRLLWEPSDDFSVDLKVNISRNEGRGIGFQFAPIYGESNVDANAVNLPFIANNEDRGTRDTEGLSLKIDKSLGFATLTSVTSWDSLETLTRADQFPYTAFANGVDAATPFGDGTQTQYTDIEGWSQELRLTSNNDDGLYWQVGAYYLSWDRFIASTTGTDTGDGVRVVTRTPFFNATDNPTASYFADDNDNTAWAIFGQVNYAFTDNLDLTVALRYDEEKRDQSVSAFNTGGQPGANNTETFDKFQPKVTLNYAATENVNVYGTWGEGFRSGQFNQNGTSAAAIGAGLAGVNDVVEQEDSESFEIGVKSELLDGQLRLNAAYFDTTVEGQQYFVFIGGIGAQVLINIDEVELSGYELDAVYRVTDGLDIYASYGVTDSEVIEYATDPSFVGNDAPYIADSTFNAGFQWRAGLSDSLDLVSRVDYEQRGEQFWSPNNVAPRDALDLVNVRVALEDSEGKWSLAAYVNNATDEEYNSEYVLGGFVHRANPRVWRLDYRYNF